MKVKSLKLKLICLTASISLISCDKFPAKYIYIKSDDSCSKVEIIKENPLEFGNGEILDKSECGTIYGFKETEVAGVTAWIRRNQSKSCPVN